MINILAIDDQVVVHMEDEVPWICECLAHIPKFVKIGSYCGLALLKLTSDVSNDCAKVLNSVEDTVKGSVAELVYDSTDPFPDVLGITEAFHTVWDFSLNGAS